jgi:glycosyltransferase involved in cell wall biosynthesis
MKRMAIFLKHAGPYHWARLDALSKQSALRIGIFGKDDKDINYEAKQSHKKLDIKTLDQKQLKQWMESSPKVDTVLIPGWSESLAIEALNWCLKNKIPAVLMADSTALDHPRKPWIEAVKSKIVNLFSSALVAGKAAADYLRELGFTAPIYDGYDVVDNKHFAKNARLARKNKASTRKRLSLPKCYFLCVAGLTPGKDIGTALKALSFAFQKGLSQEFNLVVVGDGPFRKSLEEQAMLLGVEKNSLFLGRASYDHLPAIYALSASLILPSLSETWGLVVNESLASGTPVLVSTACGCVPDLVIEGQTGMSFIPGDAETLSTLMLKIAQKPAWGKTLGAAGQQHIKTWGLERFVRGALSASEAAQAAPLKKPGLLDQTLLWALKQRGG